MLRGYIENIGDGFISGWVHSDEVDVARRLLLAFLDGRCVGAGHIDIHRPDLEAAGLGDGTRGFHFPVDVRDQEEIERLTVRFENSDFVLPPPHSLRGCAPRGDGGEEKLASSVEARLRSYDWMRARGWLSQYEHGFLIALAKFGFYERVLVETSVSPGYTGEDHLREAEEVVRTCGFGAFQTVRMSLTDGRELSSRLKEIRERESGVYALWSGEDCVLEVEEGSHISGGESGPLDNTVQVRLTSHRYVLFDIGCRFVFSGGFPERGVILIAPEDPIGGSLTARERALREMS
ncbi:hypothetical protein ACIKTA_02895 [Hansschlegelia beijingensis]